MFDGGLQSVTIAEVLAYCQIADIPKGEPALKLLRLVQRLDNARISHWHKKNKSKT